MPNQINRDIYVLSSKVKDPIDYVRLTNDIPIVFTFRDYDIPSGSAAQVYVQKPSGKAVYDTATISGNVVTVTVTDQMFAELGVSDLQIRITQGDEKLVSFSQPVRVHPNYTEGDAQQSQNEGVPVKTQGASYTGNMYDAFIACGFIDVTSQVNLSSGSGVVRGDVLLNIVNHTAMSIGNGQVVQASSNEFGGITGGQTGDQTGQEIWITNYYNFPWNKVLRYGSGGGTGIYIVRWIPG